jgi:hypothetical protein
MLARDNFQVAFKTGIYKITYQKGDTFLSGSIVEETDSLPQAGSF